MKTPREIEGSGPTHPLRPLFRLGVSSALFAAVALAQAQVGAVFEALATPTQMYREVKVLSASPSAITIKHAGGIAQVPLKQLPPEIQARFGYDPDRDAANAQAIESATQAQRAEAQKKAAAELKARTENRSERAVALFGQPAPVRPVDLRGEYRSLDFATKDQGNRPSCAIYAVIGALELESSRGTGRLDRLSENYLIWATLQSTGRGTIRGRTLEEDAVVRRVIDDLGFTLSDVLVAAARFGVALEGEMPAGADTRMTQIATPAPEIIDRAQHYRRISVHGMGGPPDVLLDNIRHQLHAGVPVLLGFDWPAGKPDATVDITARMPAGGGGHAVTLVGYTCATGRREDIRFIFRNSWGRSWGDEGYGTIEHAYLRQNLIEAAVIEVKRSPVK